MQRITTHLWFDKEAREAAQFYISILPQSQITSITTLHDTPSGSVDTVTFELLGREGEVRNVPDEKHPGRRL